jgi:hypothetical protein
MERQKVKSGNLAEIGHDEATGTLEVLFSNGGLYHHHDVPRDVYDRLLAATDSHGKAYHAIVKGKFRHTKVG